MNVDRILQSLNGEQVDHLLIGGMNFLLRHLPELTFDVDIWVRDDGENLERVNRALQGLEAAWGPTEKEWRPISNDWRWLQRQGCFCLTTAHGALDIFREVHGLEGRYVECKTAAIPSNTAGGVPYLALSDEHMLACRPNSKSKSGCEFCGKLSSSGGTEMNPQEIKREEERKRDAAYDPAQRWLHIQQTITWAEENLPPHLRRNRPRTHPADSVPKK